MIKQIEIDNFKRLKNFKTSFKQISLFGGMNNAGKSSVLEAAFLFCDRGNPNMLFRQLNWRGVNELKIDPYSIWAPFFNSYDLKKEIRISAYFDNYRETMKINYNENYEQKTVRINNINEINSQTNTIEQPVAGNSLQIEISSDIKGKQNINYIISNDSLVMEASQVRPLNFQCVFLTSKGHVPPTENAVRYGELDLLGKAHEVTDILRIVEPRLRNLSSISLPNNVSMLYGDIGLEKKIPISYMGDGISRVASIVLAIAQSKNGIVFIDEIENGIHYSVMPKIWESIAAAAKQYNCQIIASTHSYECLQSAISGMPDSMQSDFQYTRLEHYDENNLSPKSFDFEILKTAIDNEWEVR